MTQRKKIWLSPPHMGGEEIKFVQDAFDSNWISPAGPHIAAFEQELSAFNAIDHCAVLSSGTAAIHLALIILGVKRDDEVLCSSFTFSGSCNPVIYQGATPVFIDSEPDTWNMDPQLLEEAIRDRMKKGKKPKAIIVVHLYGMPAKMDEIMKLSRQYDIPVVEDAAEAIGSSYKKKMLGTFGHMGVFSFNGNKIITTSGGGALVSTSKAWIDKARFLSTQARDQAPHYQHSEIGYNYRMSNISAAIGRGQMKVLPERVRQRRAIYNWYQEFLGDISQIKFTPEPTGFYSNRWLTTILLDTKKQGQRLPEILRLELEKMEIEARPLWKPMHLQPVFSGTPAYLNGVSERLFDSGLCLPSGSAMTEEDVQEITRIIKDVASGF